MMAILLLEESVPNTELAWILYLLFGFFLLVMMVGWWANSRGHID